MQTEGHGVTLTLALQQGARGFPFKSLSAQKGNEEGRQSVSVQRSVGGVDLGVFSWNSTKRIAVR